jgi:hypothetical protein
MLKARRRHFTPTLPHRVANKEEVGAGGRITAASYRTQDKPCPHVDGVTHASSRKIDELGDLFYIAIFKQTFD